MYIKVANILARLPTVPRELLERLVDSVEAYGYHSGEDCVKQTLTKSAEALAQWVEACHREHIKAVYNCSIRENELVNLKALQDAPEGTIA